MILRFQILDLRLGSLHLVLWRLLGEKDKAKVNHKSNI
jgi:hypothetical protein